MDATIKTIIDKQKERCYTIFVSFFCNYRCSYCTETNKEEKPENLDNIAKNIDGFFSDIIEKHGDEEAKAILIGGEVSQFNLTPIISVLKKYKITRVLITTNLSAKKEWYINLINSCKQIKFHFIASFHDEYWKPRGFVEKVNYLKENGCDIQIQAVLNDDIYEKVKELLDLCKEKNIKCGIDLDMSRKNISNKCKELQKTTSSKQKYKNFVVETNDGTEQLNKGEIISKFGEDGWLNTTGTVCFDTNKNFVFKNQKSQYKASYSICPQYSNMKKIKYKGEKAVICNSKCNLCNSGYKIIFNPNLKDIEEINP